MEGEWRDGFCSSGQRDTWETARLDGTAAAGVGTEKPETARNCLQHGRGIAASGVLRPCGSGGALGLEAL